MRTIGSTIFAIAVLFGTRASGQDMILAGQLRQLQVQHSEFVLIDVRASDDFQRQRIVGAVNLQEDRLSSAAWPQGEALIVYCGDARCPLSHAAAKKLMASGYQSVKVLYGGIVEWQRKGYPVEPRNADVLPEGADPRGTDAAGISPKDIWGKMQRHESVIIIDLRPVQEFTAGHLQGALNSPLEQLSTDSFVKGANIVVYDRLPDRSRKGVALLTGAGLSACMLSGGIAVWVRLGYPLVVGAKSN